MRPVNFRTKLAVAAGAAAIQASFDPRLRQGIGFAAALAPALSPHDPPEVRAALLSRVAVSFNTHPAMVGPLLGATLRMESEADGETALRLRETLQAPLAAVGDDLFWKGLRSGGGGWGAAVSWMVGAPGAIAFLLVYNTVHLGVRCGGVWWGYRKGRDVHRILASPGLKAVRRVAAGLGWTGAALMIAAAGAGAAAGPAAAGAAGLLAGLGIGARGRGRETALAAGAAALGLIAGELSR
jgi:mannose/fructose/N-acetylgalactosamine-specific phosphotransferase system component IID